MASMSAMRQPSRRPASAGCRPCPRPSCTCTSTARCVRRQPWTWRADGRGRSGRPADRRGRHAGPPRGARRAASTRPSCCGPSTCPSPCCRMPRPSNAVPQSSCEDVAGDGTRYAEIRWAPSLHTPRGPGPARGHRGRGPGSRQRGRRERASTSGSSRWRCGPTRRRRPWTWRGRPSMLLPDGLDGLRPGRSRAPGARSAPLRAPPSRSPARAAWASPATPASGAAPPRCVRALAVDPWRIAHGAPAADDAALMAELRARDVTLDLCPTSNLQAGIGSDDAAAPLPRLMRAGVPVTISTDDRTVSDLTLVRELERAMRRLGVTPGRARGRRATGLRGRLPAPRRSRCERGCRASSRPGWRPTRRQPDAERLGRRASGRRVSSGGQPARMAPARRDRRR